MLGVYCHDTSAFKESELTWPLFQCDPQRIENAGHKKEEAQHNADDQFCAHAPLQENREWRQNDCQDNQEKLASGRICHFYSDPVLLSQFRSMTERAYLHPTITFVP